jgi:hypothetical protein
MATSLFFASPGREHGPCVDEGCGHEQCEDIRAAAATECGVCNLPIGYRTRFYADPDRKRPGLFLHGRCFEGRTRKANFGRPALRRR